MSFDQFVQQLHDYRAADHDAAIQNDTIRFAIEGIFNGIQYCIEYIYYNNILETNNIFSTIDKTVSIKLDENHKENIIMKTITDIDSILWTGNTIPANSSIKIFPFPNCANTLTTYNCMYYIIEGQKIQLNQIPNFEFAQFGNNSKFKVLLFFPLM